MDTQIVTMGWDLKHLPCWERDRRGSVGLMQPIVDSYKKVVALRCMECGYEVDLIPTNSAEGKRRPRNEIFSRVG